jgi:hypothetical protein
LKIVRIAGRIDLRDRPRVVRREDLLTLCEIALDWDEVGEIVPETGSTYRRCRSIMIE